MSDDEDPEEARRRAQAAYSQLGQPRNQRAWFAEYLKRAESQVGAAQEAYGRVRQQEAYSRVRQMERDDQDKT